MLHSIKDNDGNVIVQRYSEYGHYDVSSLSAITQAYGINYCTTTSIPSGFVRNTYFNKENSMYYWF